MKLWRRNVEVCRCVFNSCWSYAIAGSAGDCDGKCMEYANSFGEMVTYAFGGLVMFLTGSYILYKENDNG